MRRRSFASNTLKNLVIISVFFAFSFTVSNSALCDILQKKPNIVIESPVYGFGTVPQGSVVTHDFEVKNSGSMDLVIQKVVAGCGCTVANPPTLPIPPGQTAKISVSFDTSGFEGNKEKTIHVFSNDIDNAMPILTIKGYVETAFAATPTRINFGDVAKGQYTEPKKVSISIKKDSNYTIKSIDAFSKGITLKNSKVEAKNAEIEVGVSSDALAGEIRDRVIVTVSDNAGKEQSFNIPVIGTIKSSVKLIPATLSVGVIEGKEDIVRSAKLVNLTKSNLVIKEASSDSAAVRAEVKEIKKGEMYVLTVHVDPTKVNNDLRAAVTVKTNLKEQEEVILNVYGILPPKE